MMKDANAMRVMHRTDRPGRAVVLRSPTRDTVHVDGTATPAGACRPSHDHDRVSSEASSSMPAPKKPAVSPTTPARVTASTAAPSSPRAAGAWRPKAAARDGGASSSPLPGDATAPDAGSTPWMRARGVARATMRRLHAMDTTAAAMPPPMPAARARGETCSTSRVVPTASTHHVRSPHMISSA